MSTRKTIHEKSFQGMLQGCYCSWLMKREHISQEPPLGFRVKTIPNTNIIPTIDAEFYHVFAVFPVRSPGLPYNSMLGCPLNPLKNMPETHHLSLSYTHTHTHTRKKELKEEHKS